MGSVAVEALLFVRGLAMAFALMPVTTAAYKAVSADQLADATTLVNVTMRVGGAVGAAVFAVALSARLRDGPELALHTAFWWLSAASLLGVAAAAMLARVER